MDYRGLNARTYYDSYPLPNTEATLDALGGSSRFLLLYSQEAEGYFKKFPGGVCNFRGGGIPPGNMSGINTGRGRSLVDLVPTVRQ